MLMHAFGGNRSSVAAPRPVQAFAFKAWIDFKFSEKQDPQTWCELVVKCPLAQDLAV